MELRDRAAETSGYWARQVEIERRAAKAWLLHAEGDEEMALETMRAAAELAGDPATARSYYQRLVETAAAGSEHGRVVRAAAFLTGNGKVAASE